MSIWGLEMSRYVQSKNPLNLKYTQYRICFSEWSVAKRGKTDSRAAVSSCGFPAAVWPFPVLDRRQSIWIWCINPDSVVVFVIPCGLRLSCNKPIFDMVLKTVLLLTIIPFCPQFHPISELLILWIPYCTLTFSFPLSDSLIISDFWVFVDYT